jgi:hypothetical protein
MNGLRIRPMRPDEISIAVNWAAAEGWNPGFANDACFAALDPEGFLIGELEGGRSLWQICPVSVAISNLSSGLRTGTNRPIVLQTAYFSPDLWTPPNWYGSRNAIVSSYL